MRTGRSYVPLEQKRSSAEVKSAGFKSQDKSLIQCFLDKDDVYIKTAISYLGKEGWERLDKKEKTSWRKKFKTVFLGCNMLTINKLHY